MAAIATSPSSPSSAPGASPAISALHVYPIKGCKGVSCSTAELTPMGLFYDRMFMVVKEESGKFVTQRDQPRLALVRPTLPAEALIRGWGAQAGSSPLLMVVNGPGQPPLSVPLVRPAGGVPPEALRTVTCWEWTGQAEDMGEDAAQWFSQYLGVKCRLCRYLGSTPAPSCEQYAPVQGSTTVRTTAPEWANGFETRFTDGYPFLLATEASLADLNRRMGIELPMARFRPNIVVRGSGPWDEDNWKSVKVHTNGTDGVVVDLTSVKPCDRCKVTTTCQDTAVVGKEPLQTLGTFRTGKMLGWAEANKSFTHALFFGWNIVSKQSGVCISVGDRIEVEAK